MSVRVTLPWRKSHGRWLVTVYFRFDTGEVVRDRTVVGEGTTVPVRTEKQARDWGERRERDLYRAGPPSHGDASAAASKVPTVEAFGPDFIEKHARANLHKESGVDTQESILRLHIYPFVGATRLNQITDEVVADLKSRWIAGGYEYIDQYGYVRKVRPTTRAKTLNNRLSALNMLLNCAYEWKKIDRLPCRIKMLDVDDDAEAEFYEHEPYERLVVASEDLDPRIHAAILLGGDGGLRRGEVLAFNLDDIDFKMGRFHVRRNVYWKKGKPIVDVPKGKKAKPIPATPRLLAALKACRHLRGERLLYTDDGEPVTPKILKLWIIRAEMKAGLPKTGRLHVFRHTYASHLAMAGVPARTIQELCRHASLDVTMRYMHLSPNAVEEGIEKLVESRRLGGQSVTTKRRDTSGG